MRPDVERDALPERPVSSLAPLRWPPLPPWHSSPVLGLLVRGGIGLPQAQDETAVPGGECFAPSQVHHRSWRHASCEAPLQAAVRDRGVRRHTRPPARRHRHGRCNDGALRCLQGRGAPAREGDKPLAERGKRSTRAVPAMRGLLCSTHRAPPVWPSHNSLRVPVEQELPSSLLWSEALAQRRTYHRPVGRASPGTLTRCCGVSSRVRPHGGPSSLGGA